jgi:Lipocalin-like domain
LIQINGLPRADRSSKDEIIAREPTQQKTTAADVAAYRRDASNDRKIRGRPAEDHQATPTSDAERAALHKTLVAYSGKYRVEGKQFVAAVDMSWNETWTGTEQRRNRRIEHGKLFIDTAPIPAPNYPGKMVVAKLIRERDQ